MNELNQIKQSMKLTVGCMAVAVLASVLIIGKAGGNAGNRDVR